MKKLYFNMHRLIHHKTIPFFVVFFLCTLQLLAGEKQDFTKNINKEFSINSSTGTVAIYNKYGKIDVRTGNTDKVKIDINILVKARSEKEANEIFERIQIDFFNDNNLVKAQTQIASDKSWGFNWNSSCNNDFSINYLVTMPKTCKLDLVNRYGDSYVSSLDNSAQLDVKYGNFNVEKIGGSLCITLGYGNGTVNSATQVNAGISYGNLTLQDATKMEIETKYSNVNVKKINEMAVGSKYSNYTIGEVNKISNESKYDKYDITTINELYVKTAYTDVKIGNLIQLANAEMSYGKLYVKQLSENFKAVNFDGKYSDCILCNPSNASFMVSAQMKYGDVIAPSCFTSMKDISDSSSRYVEGFFGSRNSNSRVNVNISYGNLKFK